MKISRSICIVFVGLLLFAFQNCSDVEFANVDSATKGTAAPTIPEVVEGLENGEIEEPDGIVDADPDDPDYVYEDDPVDENYPTDEDTNNGEYADEGGEPLDLDNYACDQDDGREGVLVCHVPGGNPENRHNICISVNGLNGHLHQNGNSSNHSEDYLGLCN